MCYLDVCAKNSLAENEKQHGMKNERVQSRKERRRSMRGRKTRGRIRQRREHAEDKKNKRMARGAKRRVQNRFCDDEIMNMEDN